MAACAVEPNPRGDFPGWLAARGMKLTFAEAMERELGISDYEELLACAEDAQVTGELLGAARDRLPFAFYAVLRRLVLAMAPARQPRQRGANSVASDDARDERRAALDEDDDDAGACGPRCEDARASRAVLGSLLDAIVATLSSLSRELLHSAQRFRCLEPALEPGYRGSIGMAGSISPAENRMDADMVDDENVDSLADLQRDEMGMNGHSGSSHKPCAERIHGAHCDSGTEPPFLSIKVEQEDETEGSLVVKAKDEVKLESAWEHGERSSEGMWDELTVGGERKHATRQPPRNSSRRHERNWAAPTEAQRYRRGSAPPVSSHGTGCGGNNNLATATTGEGGNNNNNNHNENPDDRQGFPDDCGEDEDDEATGGGSGSGRFACGDLAVLGEWGRDGASGGRERRFRCHVCGKRFLKGRDVTRHMRTHTGEKPYACEACGVRFTQSYSLTRHWRRRHSTRPLPPLLPPPLASHDPCRPTTQPQAADVS